MTMYRNCKGINDSGLPKDFDGFNQQQLECLRLLFEWRWRTAKENDESVAYTLPNKILLRIASKVPSDVDSLKETCAAPTIPPLVEEKIEVRK